MQSSELVRTPVIVDEITKQRQKMIIPATTPLDTAAGLYIDFSLSYTSEPPIRPGMMQADTIDKLIKTLLNDLTILKNPKLSIMRLHAVLAESIYPLLVTATKITE